MHYCKQCIIPSTRPNIQFDHDGVCNACRANEFKRKINWKERERLFRTLVNKHQKKRPGYDCLIPVSGGKDSFWQVVKCLEYDMKPLTVTWKAPSQTALGGHNLRKLVELGVDHIDFQINPKVEKKFLLETFKTCGSSAVPMHMAIFHIPLQMALQFGISLILWGENSALEYGGKQKEWDGSTLDSVWFKKYGVTQGTSATDWVSSRLTKKELTPYFGAGPDAFKSKKLTAAFLGYYFPWDPLQSAKIARQHGFQSRAQGPKTGWYDFADIDDDFISIHHFMKWYKFGFTRTFDNLSIEIRNGRMSRECAIEILKQRGDETPYEDIQKFCLFTGISRKKFFELAERFRNPRVWKKSGGEWMIPGFLIKNWSW
ncbi:MAG: N-acetyl sugar amidotransferase [Candidatus Omnitrophica bacterium]|nr:N-acetyl sugar amidotransferase [Candidatus Omnitrophota bacterium]